MSYSNMMAGGLFILNLIIKINNNKIDENKDDTVVESVVHVADKIYNACRTHVLKQKL